MQVNCEYEGYNFENKTAVCECEFRIKIPLMEEIIISKDLLLKNFIDIKQTTNIEVLKCYYIFFTYEGFIHNIGNYILLFIIFIEIICLIIFLYKGYKLLYYKIKNIAEVDENQKEENAQIKNGKTIKKKKFKIVKRKIKEIKNDNNNKITNLTIKKNTLSKNKRYIKLNIKYNEN